ncbi:MAG: PepSY domain-containing protein [Steroidobacter sp.]
MTTALQLRTWHKWLGLAIGLQVLLWCVSGLYMVAADIDFIHGDSLVRNERPALAQAENLIPMGSLLRKHQGLYGAKLRVLPDADQPVYQLGTREGPVTIDAITGEALSPFPQPRIEQLARSYYAGSGRLASAELIDHVPVEIRGRRPYLWRVDFDDWLDTSFYLDGDTGVLVTRRHRLWRIFDTFWMLHVMDYGYERDDVNNALLRVTSAIGVIFGVTGIWLLFYSFRNGFRRPVRMRRPS